MYSYWGDTLFTSLERSEPEPGMMLVAAPGLPIDEFNRSVLLIIQHNDALTVGVDLTRRSEIAVHNVLPDWVSTVAKPQALYIGGPVNQQAVLGLGVTRSGVDMSQHEHLNKLAPRLAHVDLRADPAEMGELVENMRLFAGCATWSPGQLDEEIQQGFWYVVPALPGDVVMPGRADLWSDVLRRQPMPLPLFSTYPSDVVEN